jgi:hypothetical protein
VVFLPKVHYFLKTAFIGFPENNYILTAALNYFFTQRHKDAKSITTFRFF